MGILIWIGSVLVGYLFLYLTIRFAISDDMYRLTTEINTLRAQNERLHNDSENELKEIKNLLKEQNNYLSQLVEKNN